MKQRGQIMTSKTETHNQIKLTVNQPLCPHCGAKDTMKYSQHCIDWFDHPGCCERCIEYKDFSECILAGEYEWESRWCPNCDKQFFIAVEAVDITFATRKVLDDE
jgi:hypothetical protein